MHGYVLDCLGPTIASTSQNGGRGRDDGGYTLSVRRVDIVHAPCMQWAYNAPSATLAQVSGYRTGQLTDSGKSDHLRNVDEPLTRG
jgi:hypothetical protein